MIGLIGPSDSVAFAMAVATEGGYADQLVSRVYDHADQTIPLVRELNQTCQVILFTGQAPYSFVVNSGEFAGEIQFISHSGIDLYRCIVQVLMDHGGRMPTVSIDSIDEELVLSGFSEMGLPTPSVHPIITPDGEMGSDAIERVVEFHRDAITSGRVETALTCLAEVNSRLVVEGLPVWRIEHTRATVAQALETARLSDQLIRSRGEQLAVALFQIDSQAQRKLDVYERELARLRVHRELLEIARKSGGRLEALEGGEFALTTTRGVIEAAISREAAGHASLLQPLKPESKVRVGVGIGASFSQAESNARHALGLSILHDESHVVFPDGRVYSSKKESTRPALRLDDDFGSFLKLSRRLGIGPLSTKRLIDALKRMGDQPFSAQQLAEAYGVQVRSSRRFITALISEGFAEEVGLWAKSGAGRPKSLYRVDTKALIDSLAELNGV